MNCKSDISMRPSIRDNGPQCRDEYMSCLSIIIETKNVFPSHSVEEETIMVRIMALCLSRNMRSPLPYGLDAMREGILVK